MKDYIQWKVYGLLFASAMTFAIVVSAFICCSAGEPSTKFGVVSTSTEVMGTLSLNSSIPRFPKTFSIVNGNSSSIAVLTVDSDGSIKGDVAQGIKALGSQTGFSTDQQAVLWLIALRHEEELRKLKADRDGYYTSQSQCLVQHGDITEYRDCPK